MSDMFQHCGCFFVVNARWELDTQIFFSISLARFVKKAVCVSYLSVLRGV